jgi:predicted ester cyclase
MSSTPKDVGPLFFNEQDRLRGGPAAELCAPAYRAIINANAALDLTGHQQFAKAFYSAFPDLSHTIEDIVADDDLVAVRLLLRGTHRAPFMGLAATNRSIAVFNNAILRVADGRVTELRAVFDQMTMMKQLGVLPS